MNDIDLQKEDADLMRRVARQNPVATTALTQAEQIRAEMLLARLEAQPKAQPTQSATRLEAQPKQPARSATHLEAQPTRRPTAPPTTRPAPQPAKNKAPQIKRHRRRVLRGIAIAGASVFGLTGVAWAADITPTSVSAGLEILRSADAGTVTYSNERVEDGSVALDRIVESAASSGVLGEGDTSMLVSAWCGDQWFAEASEPDLTCGKDETWALPDGNTRMRRTVTDGSTPNWFEEWAPLEAGQNNDASSPHGLKVSLGPTVADTTAALVPQTSEDDEAEDSAQSQPVESWQLVESYLGGYTTGLGISPQNRAAFWIALAQNQYTYYGTATDSTGRSGEVFAVERQMPGYVDETRLLVDPSNGTILAVETVAHGPWFIRGSQNHVTSSQTYLDYQLVATPPPCADIAGCKLVSQG